MRILLDTHALLWAVLTPSLLSESAARHIADERNTKLVSAASAWEISTKVRLGKLPGAQAFEMQFLDASARAGYIILPIHAVDALRAGRLMGRHGDPFDRIIAAQALAEDIPVVSRDPLLDLFGVRRIW